MDRGETEATILAIGWFIADMPGGTTYDEAVRLRGMTFDQAAVGIKARVAQADWPQIERQRSVIGSLQQLTRGRRKLKFDRRRSNWGRLRPPFFA
jgi:hypothetical protein